MNDLGLKRKTRAIEVISMHYAYLKLHCKMCYFPYMLVEGKGTESCIALKVIKLRPSKTNFSALFLCNVSCSFLRLAALLNTSCVDDVMCDI